MDGFLQIFNNIHQNDFCFVRQVLTFLKLFLLCIQAWPGTSNPNCLLFLNSERLSVYRCPTVGSVYSCAVLGVEHRDLYIKASTYPRELLSQLLQS